MGYSSITKELNKASEQMIINAVINKQYCEVTEASQASFFNKPISTLVKLFSQYELCDNGKIILKNNLGDFVCLQ